MHAEAWEFLEKYLPSWNDPRFKVVEFGSRDVNGSTRTLLPRVQLYWGIDIESGPGVNEVVDAADWEPNDVYDLVISTETFEHTPQWPKICRTAYEALATGGMFIVTAATDPREPHSAVDGHILTPDDHEYYENVDPWTLEFVLRVCGFVTPIVTVHSRGDVYATAMK